MSDELKATADRVVAECWDGDELNMQDLIAAITAALKAEREECAKVAETFKKPVPPKPTIEELERILAQDTDPGIEITPDGEVRAAGTHICHDIAAAIRGRP